MWHGVLLLMQIIIILISINVHEETEAVLAIYGQDYIRWKSLILRQNRFLLHLLQRFVVHLAI